MPATLENRPSRPGTGCRWPKPIFFSVPSLLSALAPAGPTLSTLAPAVLILSTLAGCGGGEGEPGAGGSEKAAVLELDAAYPEPFSYLSGVRELPDGRVLTADPLSQVLLRVDLDAGTADTLGGVGGGPQEYEQPDRVFPLPGDSSLLVDLGKTYLTVVGPEGELHGGMSMALPTADGRPSLILPRAVDGAGNLYFRPMASLGEGPPDSIAIVRHHRDTELQDTVAMAWQTAPTVSRSGGSVRVSLPRMVPNDDWAVGRDGRVAVIRANGYYVEWHLPDGTVVTGPETPYEARPISRADKEADLEESSGGGLSVMVSRSTSGATSMRMSRGRMGGGGEEPTVEEQEWGELFPPFQDEGSVVSPSNEVWVLRWLPADRPPEMDVFGPDGVRRGTVRIPPDTRLIGFGEGPGGEDVAYLVRTDDVDLQWLERYRVVRE